MTTLREMTSAAPDGAPPGERSGLRPRPVLAVGALSVGAFSFVTAETLPIGLLPQIGADLHRTLSGSGLLVTAYALIVLVMSVPLTLLTRRIPRRPLLGALFVAFTAATLAAAAAPSFGVLVGARLLTALAQALFWSVVVPTATTQVPLRQRARAVSAVFTGSALGPVVGMPAGTWLGQQLGWRTAFLALATLAAATCVALVLSLPATRREAEAVHVGDHPDARGYAVLLVVITLAIAGTFTTYTYVTAHLVQVAGLPARALSAVLLLTGGASIAGAALSVALVRRSPRAGIQVPLALMVAAAGSLHLAGRWVIPAVLTFALMALAGSSFAAALATRVLTTAPGDTDIASAGSSSAYNAGIGAGAWLGAQIVATHGVHATALGALALTTAALAVAACHRPRAAQRSPGHLTGERPQQE